jgi:thimet oligopeptidase
MLIAKSIVLCILTAMLTYSSGCKNMPKKVNKMTYSQERGYAPHPDLSGEKMPEFCKEHIAMAEALKASLIAGTNGDFHKTLESYNDILTHMDAVMSRAGLFSQVHPNEKVREEAENCEKEASRFMTDFSLDREVFAALKKGESLELDADASRLLKHSLRDFYRSGVDKDDETRKKIKTLKDKLVTIGQEFGQNIRDERLTIMLDSVEDLAGLPQDYIDSHKPNADGKIEISTDYPDYIPFMTYAKSEKLRKELYLKYYNRGQKNRSVLPAMIENRHELAKLLNYDSFAGYIVEDKMIKNPESIHDFIDKISQLAKAGADREYNELVNFKKTTVPDATSIRGYENAFWEEAYKKEKFHFDSQEVRPYFSYSRVRDGLLAVTAELFDIRYELVSNARVWHDSVQVYDVFDKDGKLGRIYLDMHPRDGKYKHAAQFTVLSGLTDRQYPEGALVCNLPDPNGPDKAALMQHDQVVTMFHEFGHLLHHIFAGKQEWISFSGVATEWDFVEAPSQFLEEWAWSTEVLQKFARHYVSNEAISEDQVKRMRAADEFGKAISARQQMFYAALSADYFDKDPASFDLLTLLKDLQSRYSYFPYEEGTHFHYSFGHLDGYSAMYYTYMWSLSIAKDLFEPFRREGLMNKEIAARFRDTVLKPGGRKDASELVRDFLGRPFKFDAFEKWLTSDPLSANRL